MRKSLCVLALVALCVGCEKQEYKVAPVSGRLTLDGKPAPEVAVMFQPIAEGTNINPGPGSYGITDEEGRYTMKLVGEETAGAVVGKHKVRMDPYPKALQQQNFPPAEGAPVVDQPTGPIQIRTKVPTKYNQVDSPLEFTVPPEGTDKADFNMESK